MNKPIYVNLWMNITNKPTSMSIYIYITVYKTGFIVVYIHIYYNGS